MLDTLRLVSSEDVGRDEANVQSLLKKHKDVTDELKNYSSIIETLHKQAEQLGEQDRQSPEVSECKWQVVAIFQQTISSLLFYDYGSGKR